MSSGQEEPMALRRLRFETLLPELPAAERCARFAALPDHERRRYWADLAAAEAELRERESALGLHEIDTTTDVSLPSPSFGEAEGSKE